jgi:hypothetical protein
MSGSRRILDGDLGILNEDTRQFRAIILRTDVARALEESVSKGIFDSSSQLSAFSQPVSRRERHREVLTHLSHRLPNSCIGSCHGQP